MLSFTSRIEPLVKVFAPASVPSPGPMSAAL